jgi:hypothetical protein
VRGIQLLLRLPHAGLRAAHIGVRRAQIAAGVDGGDGHIHVGRRGVGLGAGQSRLGVLDRNLVVRWVQLGDHVARLHHLVLLDVDLGDLARNAGAHLDQVAVDLRVVGVFAIGGAPPEPGGNQHEDRNHDSDDDSAAGVRLRDLVAIVRIDLRWCWSKIRHVYFPPR